jgi:predicted CoA-substrate-specific enzyme activase
MKYYLGCDVGSVSIKMIVIDDDYNVVAKTYKTNNNVIGVLKESLNEIRGQFTGDISGFGCTGSGREFTKLILGADVIKTEIYAHTTSVLHYYPDVKTVFDIGGEDCKIITIENNMQNNYIMNNVCGAGSGSVITNVANLLNVNIEDVGGIAIESKNDIAFPGKCGVLCQSAVISKKNKGFSKADILMGVCRALINNYLSLTKNIDLKPKYIFQGKTARNVALVKALEEQLNDNVYVPEHAEHMGALGIAIIAKEANIAKTHFIGFEFDVEIENILCDRCTNRCELISITKGNVSVLHGAKCGRER